MTIKNQIISWLGIDALAHEVKRLDAAVDHLLQCELERMETQIDVEEAIAESEGKVYRLR